MKKLLVLMTVLSVAACSGAAETTAPVTSASLPSTTPSPTVATPATTAAPPPSVTPAELNPAGFVKALFGPDAPSPVLVQSGASLVLVTDGAESMLSWDQPVLDAAGEYLASYEYVTSINDLDAAVAYGCPELFRRGDQVVVADWCLGPELRLFDAATSDELEAPEFAFPRNEAAIGLWYAAAADTEVFMQIDVEGNLMRAETGDGVDVVGDDYAGIATLSNDGALFVYGDQSRSPSPHLTDTIAMRRTVDGSLVDRWQIEGVVDDVQSDGRWLVISELDPDAALEGDARVVATTVVDLESGAVTRIESEFELILPR